MNFNYTEEEKNFLIEVREFFQNERELVQKARKEWNAGFGFGTNCWKILRKLGENGWLCPTWPKHYGGLELDYMHRYIISEEMHYFLDIYATVGAGMAGPVILSHGSEEQKQKYLLPIAKGEIEFALGYTEPDAGSDLAKLSLKAEDKGDHYLLNGSKIFNTRVHYAQYHWLGARTAKTKPEYKGISLFIVDLKSEGITVTPILTVGGVRSNSVFYDNVRVPKTALVGEENMGFYYILEALDYERICTVSGLQRDFTELKNFLRNNDLEKDIVTRQKIGKIATEIEAARLLALKVACMLKRNKIPNHEAAMLKMLVSETEQELVDAAIDMLGAFGIIRSGSKYAPLDGQFERKYRDSLENLITRGTSEIMRNVIATRGLNLPRG